VAADVDEQQGGFVAIAVGIVMGIWVGLFGSLSNMDRDRAFYPTIVVVVAFYYALFAVMGGSMRALAAEAGPIVVFILASLMGFRKSLWAAVVALVGHGVFDVLHGTVISNPGVPEWWPAFCSSIDVTMGAYLAWLLQSKRLSARVR
jgi:hypothetical protein